MKNHYAGIFIVTALFVIAACSMPLEGVGIKPETPAAPALTAGNGSLTASWSADRAESYRVYLSTTATVPQEPAYTGTRSSTVFTGLANWTTYYVWVQALNDRGDSALSERTSISLPVPGTPLITAGDEELTVTWTGIADADAYEVWKGTVNNSSGAEKYSDIPGTSVTITGLTNGTRYYVWIKAKKGATTGSFTPVASAVPYRPPEIINIGYTGAWTLQGDGSRKSPAIGHSNTTKMRVTFTSTVANAKITILLKVSSSSAYYEDRAFIGKLDDASATPGNCYPGSLISGTTSIPLTIPVPSAGDHFIDIGYSKDSDFTAGSDCAWFTVITVGPGETLNSTINNVRYTGAWTLQGDGSRKSPAIGHGNTTKMRVFFTGTAATSITILLKVSSSSAYYEDRAFIGKLDDASATRSNYYPGSLISGTTSIPVSIPVPSAGDHFIDIGYSKDSDFTAGSDCAWFTLVP
jgi:hypothetical protein